MSAEAPKLPSKPRPYPRVPALGSPAFWRWWSSVEALRARGFTVYPSPPDRPFSIVVGFGGLTGRIDYDPEA